MKLSAQEEYGLRCLITLAKSKSPLTIPEIAKQEGLSQPYVGKLLNLLRKADLVKSIRGQVGGYYLSEDPTRISLLRVLAILGGRLYEPEFCQRHAGLGDLCSHSEGCRILPLWQQVQEAVDQVLNRYVLADFFYPLAVSQNVEFYEMGVELGTKK